MQQVDEDLQDKIKQLVEISEALGVLKHMGPSNFSLIKLAYHPFESTQALYAHLGLLQTVWQKLLHKASLDPLLIQSVYTNIHKMDPFMEKIFAIWSKKANKVDQNTITFGRCDYYLNEHHEPKLTEYNLMSVGMLSHMQQFQKAKSLCDKRKEGNYVKSETTDDFAQAIADTYKLNSLKGLCLFLVYEKQPNYFDQKRLEVQILERGVECMRATFAEINLFITVDQNNDLFFKNKLISVVYYRSGYQWSDFEEDPVKSWESKSKIELSNAITIPRIQMELMNQKRMQVELSKPEVYSKYLNAEEADLIKKTLVDMWDFDKLSHEEQNEFLKKLKDQNPEGYILKPNKEGGGNNISGSKIFPLLQKLSLEQRRQYILMEKIRTEAHSNLILEKSAANEIMGHYELSRYGVILTHKGDVIQNSASGFLIRVKPQSADEGGIMTGIGSIASWRILIE